MNKTTMSLKKQSRTRQDNSTKTVGQMRVPMKEKSTTKRILRREKVVPISWNQDNYEANMQELQAKIDNQRKYIKLQQNKAQRNEELLHQMKWQQIEPMIKFQSMKDEVGRLGDETRGYETEIKYYTSLADTSDTSNKMAEKAYKDNVKYGKNLEKTLTLLQDKTSRLHDNQAVTQCKDAIHHMREEVDKQDVLIARMGWYQDNIQRCQIQIQEPDIGTIPHRLEELQQAPLPGIPRQCQFRVPSPPITSTIDLPRKLKLPQIESAKVPSISDELLCLNHGTHEKDNASNLVPSPPLTPRVPRKSRSIFSRK